MINFEDQDHCADCEEYQYQDEDLKCRCHCHIVEPLEKDR